MKNYSLLISKKLYARNILVFLFAGLIFLLYHSKVNYGNWTVFILLNFLILLIFLFTAFNAKAGFYIFIFFLPLLNSITTMMQIRSIDFPLYLFFGLFLGFLLNFFNKDFNNKLEFSQNNYYEKDIIPVAFIFLGMLVLSLAVTLFRYANFYPFITNNYYDLKINLAGFTSSSAMSWTIKYFFNYAIIFFFLFAVFNIIERKKDILITIMVLLSSTGLSSIFAIYQYHFNPTLGSFSHWAESGRINSTFADPNALGAYCVILFPVFLAIVVFTKRWYYRLIFSILFILFIMMAFYSGSRTALLCMILTLIIFLIYGITKYIRYLSIIEKRKRIINYAIIFPSLLIIIISFSIIFLTDNALKASFFQSEIFKRTSGSINTFFYHFNELGIVEGLKSISNYRYFFWDQAIHMAEEYPLTGVGPGAYLLELPDYLQRFGKGFTEIDFAGNYYLQVLSEFGVWGLFTILFVFFLVIKKTAAYYIFKKKTGINKIDDRFLFGLFVSFIIFLIALIFGPHTNFSVIQFTFWLIIALIFSYIKISQQQLAKGSDDSVFDKNGRFLKKPLLLTGDLKITLRQKISLALILFIFFTSFMISSFTSLSINSKQNRCYFENTYGFYDYEIFEERDVRWISIDSSSKIEKNGNVLVVPIQDGYPFEAVENLAPPKPLVADFYIDNFKIKRVKLEDDSWYNVTLNIPDFTQDWFTLTIVLNRSWVPKDLELNFDTRELGARIGEYEFE